MLFCTTQRTTWPLTRQLRRDCSFSPTRNKRLYSGVDAMFQYAAVDSTPHKQTHYSSNVHPAPRSRPPSTMFTGWHPLQKSPSSTGKALRSRVHERDVWLIPWPILKTRPPTVILPSHANLMGRCPPAICSLSLGSCKCKCSCVIRVF